MDRTLLNILQDPSPDTISLEVRASAFYQGTAAVYDFSQKIIIPQLRSIVRLSIAGSGLSQKDEAIICTYYRMFALIGSAVDLTHPLCYQTISSNARTVMELLFDLHYLTKRIIQNPIDKYWAFPKVELYRVSKLIVNYKNDNSDSTIDDTPFRKFLDKHTEDEINALIIEEWGSGKDGRPIRPYHWTGLDLASRAERLNRILQDQYTNFNAMLSWNIHSGSVGHAGSNIDTETFLAIYGNSHGIIQALFLEGTSIISRELKLSKAIDWIDETVEELLLVPGKYLLGKQIDEINNQTSGLPPVT